MDIWKYASAEQYKDMLLSFALLSGPDWPPKRIMACLYALSNHPEAHYHALSVPKKSGGVRRLLAPDPLMKQVQRNLLHHVLEGFSPSEAAMAYRRGVSAKDHAARHCGQRVVLTLDIQDFFDSITFPQVLARCFPIIYFPRPVGVLLASLCCAYERLPQGAPTSPAVSNLVMKPFDEHMLAWCGERDITYSRYCDDMTFSGDFDFREVKGKAEGFLEAMGMALNRKKTRVSFRGGRQAVTGLVVNERPGVPREYKRRLRQEIYQYRKFGLPGTETDSEKYRARLLGKIRYVLSVQPEDAWFAQAEQELIKEEPIMTHEEKAKQNFLNGYNCAQAVFCAFCDVTGMEEKEALRLSSSFGGGMGRLREVCGAVSGMFMAAGLLYGYDNVEDKALKAEHYARIQELAARFAGEEKTIICRELLGLSEKHSEPVPEDRTAAYYQNRPCPRIVAAAARILEEYIKEQEAAKSVDL